MYGRKSSVGFFLLYEYKYCMCACLERFNFVLDRKLAVIYAQALLTNDEKSDKILQKSQLFKKGRNE